MARMAYTAARTSYRSRPPGVDLALTPIDAADDQAERSIDSEAIGTSWYESSWLLRRGLVVDEDPPPEAIPPEWQWKWWLESVAGRTPVTQPKDSVRESGEAGRALLTP